MTAPQTNRSATRRVAELGNALILAAVALICANGPFLFSDQKPVPSFVPAGTHSNGRVVVLVVIDGFRNVMAQSARTPTLSAYANGGGIRTVELETLVPSTISGIRAIVEGAVPPPTSFVADFRSPPAQNGGVLAAASLNGVRIAAAGPHLWNDLYGKWIDRSLGVFGLVREDATVLRFAKGAVQNARNQLVIAHFSGPDSAAHRYGAESAEYRERVEWCDRAVGEIASAAPTDAMVIVTGDHGLTAGGGHAGPEPAVLRTMLFCNTPALLEPDSPLIPQSEVSAIVARGLGMKTVAGGKTAPAKPALVCAAVILVALSAWWSVARIASAEAAPGNTAFRLNAAVWISLLALWWSALFSGLVAVGTLLLCAFRVADARGRGEFWNVFVWAGITFGGLRLMDASLTGTFETANPASPLLLGTLCVVALCAPAMISLLARATRHSRASSGRIDPAAAGWLGVASVVFTVAAARIAGETISFSTLDVRLSFQLLTNGTGLPLAIAAAALRPFAFPLLLLIGIVAATYKLDDMPRIFVAALRGVAPFICGQILFAGMLFPFLYLNGALSEAGYLLGLLVREFAWISVMFPAVAVVLKVLQRREIRTGGADRDFTSRERPVTVPGQ